MVALITERPLCLLCVGERASLPSTRRVEEVLDAIAATKPVQREVGRCHACGTRREIVSIRSGD